MKRRGNLVTECVFCGEEEDANHVMKCLEKTQSRQSILNGFSKLLDSIETDPIIQYAMCRSMKYWIIDIPEPEPNTQDQPELQGIRKAILQQSQIGWNLFVRGFMTIEFERLQENYLKSNNKPRSCNQWSSKIIKW
jgi:hypothetical protein